MAEENTPLIVGIEIPSTEGILALKEIIKKLSTCMRIEKVSSAYKVISEHKQSTLVAALSGEPIDMQMIKELMRTWPHAANRGSIKVLFYGQNISLTPDLTLPDPEFHLEPKSVFPVAELSPDFIHPVLKVNIRELSQRFAQKKWGEFVAHPQTILDF